jgi:hypothetical protein
LKRSIADKKMEGNRAATEKAGVGPRDDEAKTPPHSGESGGGLPFARICGITNY